LAKTAAPAPDRSAKAPPTALGRLSETIAAEDETRAAIADLARQLLDLDEGDLSHHERAIIQRAMKRMAVSRDIGLEFARDMTFGQRLADHVAAIGGSWAFIMGFFAVLVIWVVINAVVLATGAFDPYPFILLNLFLSILASIQGPIILMSQNRAAVRDRLMARHDYEVNLKAEIEIAALHAKLDEIRGKELRLLCEGIAAMPTPAGAPEPDPQGQRKR
jgi:uncharacterized membrane protein